MMANDGYIAKDTLFGPERFQARAIDWDQSDRGLSSGRAATVLQIRRRIHGRNRNHASFNRNALAPREPSIHGPSGNGECGMDASMISQMKNLEDENPRLKRMFADLSMQADLLKEALGKSDRAISAS